MSASTQGTTTITTPPTTATITIAAEATTTTKESQRRYKNILKHAGADSPITRRRGDAGCLLSHITLAG